MKALSICQPWATLIVIGAKRFETRSWKTNHRGPIAIHASKTKSPTGLLLAGREPFRAALAAIGITDAKTQLPFGAVIGTADVVDCHISDHLDESTGLTETERAFGDFRPSRWAWQLANAIMFTQPIPFSGRVGLFEFNDNLFLPLAA